MSLGIRLALVVVAGATLTAAGAVILNRDQAASDSSMIFHATADATADLTQPDRSLGTDSPLVVDGDPQRRTFVQFTVTGLERPPGRALLRLHVAVEGDSDNGGSVWTASPDWTEGSVTWNAQPARTGEVIALFGPVTADAWHTVDVTSEVTGNGVYSFLIASPGSDGAYYDSRESGENGPQLVVEDGTRASDAPVLLAAGDIALCAASGDRDTAALVDSLPGAVATLGDNSQDEGTPEQFRDCFDPTWGTFRDRIHPSPGNHDYLTPGAAGYFGYFGAAAGPPDRGYYSYDLGTWHIVALNSNCDQIGGCHPGSPQEVWLRADLAANPRTCTLAYWHHSLFTSGAVRPPAVEVRPLFQALYDAGAEVVLSGHNHVYERFAPQTPTGELDEVRGVRQFVVGTGGASHYDFTTPVMPNSEVRDNDAFGVLQLTLNDVGYQWQFRPIDGKHFTDDGATVCHD